MQEDGLNTADWLRALSRFTAGACRKYIGQSGLHVLCQVGFEDMPIFYVLGDKCTCMTNSFHRLKKQGV